MEKSLNKVSKPKNWLNIICQDNLNEEKIIFKYGFIFFNLGIFFLASAPFFGTIFILISIFFSLINFKIKTNFKNPTNKFLTLSFILLLFNTFFSIFFKLNYFEEWNFKLNLISLLNWLPFFLCFIFLQPYLKFLKYRNILVNLLLIGSLPVIFSGFAEYFFGWDNTLKTLNGSIIWFLKPINESKGMSGLFSNPNYAASWLIVIWPVAIGAFLSNLKVNLKGFITFITLILFFISILLTNSKDTWLALFIPIPFLINLGLLRYLILFLFVLGTVFLIPKNYFLKISEYSIFPLLFNSNLENNLNNLIDYFPRLDIWRVSIIAIFEKPFFGWGASSFPLIYSLYKMNFVNDKIQHSHNLFFETSISYGLIFSTIIFTLFFRLLFDSWKVIFKKNGDLVNKSLWLATLLFIINHMFDVTYYDVRLSMIFWILLASLESILKEDELTNNLEIKSN